MIKIKKIIVMFFLVLLLLLSFSACKNNENADDDNPTDSATDAQNHEDNTDSDEEPVTEEIRLSSELEAVDFDGYNFTFLTRTWSSQTDWEEWDHRDIFAEEVMSEPIIDAVYNRNKKIEEKYNITITEVPVNDLTATIRKTVGAGDNNYDVVCPHLNEIMTISQAGNLIDLFEVPNIDFEKIWWNQGCIRDLSIGGRLFIIQGDLLILDNDAMEAMIFNKTVLQANELEDPYNIVRSGEWTFDKYIEMAKGASKDLNGDGKMYIKDDLFGSIVQGDIPTSFIVSGGAKICGKDADDYPVITFNTDRCYSIMEKLADIYSDPDNFVNLHTYYGQFGIYDEQVKMMEENRALFSWIRMRIVERLRGMNTDFGIIPLPKLDKEQENYITNMNAWTGAGVSVPNVDNDFERTGMILEDLCAESRYTLQPAFYEINLVGKFIRDDDSREMLDIILNNTAYDIGYIYNFGNFTSNLGDYCAKKTYASGFEKAEPKMQKDIDKTIDAYEKIG